MPIAPKIHLIFSAFWSKFQTSSPPPFILLSTAAAAAAKLLQSCPTLCDPMDCSQPGSSVPGILQARMLEWLPCLPPREHTVWRLLLLSRFSSVWLCATPQTAAHQAPPSLGFSRQEHWSGLPFPSPMHESEKWKWSRSVVSNPQQPHGLQPSRLLHPWDSPGKSTGVGCHCLLRQAVYMELNSMACATEAKWCSKGNI